MRVLHVIPYFYPGNRFGGVPEAVRSLVNAQASLGYEIYVLNDGRRFGRMQRERRFET